MNKENIVIFGASGGGRLFFEKVNHHKEVVCYSDNNKELHGKEFLGLPVVAPEIIQSFDYDLIYIASLWADEIEAQLICQLNIPAEKIRRVPKSLQSRNKAYRPFEDSNTYALAKKSFLFVLDLLEEAGIPYFIDHGTLLGIVRDGDLMPWDDDIDISVPVSHRKAAIACLLENIESMPGHGSAYWRVETFRQSEEGDVGILAHLTPRDDSINKFSVTIWFIFFRNGNAEEFINIAPEHHFLSHDTIEYQGRRIRIPVEHQSYLECHYGDWRTPKKDISFNDINNYKKPEQYVRLKHYPYPTGTVGAARLAGRVITFGTFDLFHQGHINILSRARALGSGLIVGVSSDELSEAKKGFKPLFPLNERMAIIKALRDVDAIFVEESLECKRDYILKYGADILVMGDDWRGRFDDLSDICEVIYLPRTEDISTTAIKERMRHPL